MASFAIDIVSGGVLQGAGPIATASKITIARRLDQAGTFTADLPANDPATAEVIAKRIAQVNGLLGTPAARALTTFGSGVIDKIDRRVDFRTGGVGFTLSGDDIMGLLANTIVGNLELSNDAGGPTSVGAALTAIMALATGWTIDSTTYASTGTTTSGSVSVTGVTNIANFAQGKRIVGTGIPAGATVASISGTTITLSAAATASGTVTLDTPFYLQFAGESVLTALNKVATTVGQHFRLGTGQQVIWLYKVQPSSGVRIINAGDSALVNNDEVAILKDSLDVSQDTHGVVTRVYPSGGGNAKARVTLNNATDVAPSGYTRVIDSLHPDKSYIQHDAGVATYGVIERAISYKDTSPAETGTTTTAKQSTGNQVQQQAVEFLRLNTVPLVTYRFSVVKLDVAVYPGQTVQLVYRRTVDGVRVLDEDTTLLVMDSTIEFDAATGGTTTTGMTVSTVDRRPASDVGTLVAAISTIQSMDAHYQDVPHALVADDITTTATPTVLGAIINGVAGTLRDLIYQTAGLARWALRTDGTAEGGSNAGSDFRVVGYADDGTTATTYAIVKRSNGWFNIGNGSNAPGSLLQVGGAIATAIAAKAGAYTLTATDSTILMNASGGARTATLPTAVGCSGRVYVVKKSDSSANAVTIATTSSQTIDGAATYTLAAQNNAAALQSDGANWFVVGKV